MAETKITWTPEDYDPELSVGDWKKMLADKDVVNDDIFALLKRFKDSGEATYVQLAETYGETQQFYKDKTELLAKKVAEKTGCQVFKDKNGENVWWSVFCFRRNGQRQANYFFVFKLRDELSEALDEIDLSKIPLYTAEKIAEPVALDANTEKKVITLTLDDDRKVPMKSYLASTDGRVYYLLTETGETKIRNAVAIKLLSNNFAYKVTKKEFDNFKADAKANKFSMITAEEFDKVKSIFKGKAKG